MARNKSLRDKLVVNASNPDLQPFVAKNGVRTTRANMRHDISESFEAMNSGERDRYRNNLRNAPQTRNVASESKMLDAQEEAEQQVLLSRRNRRKKRITADE